MAHWPRMLGVFPLLTSQASHTSVSVPAPGRLAARQYTPVASRGSRRHIDACHHLTIRCVVQSFDEGLVESLAQAELRNLAEGFRVGTRDIVGFRTSG